MAHVAIGNSDDKLTQQEWSLFVADLDLAVAPVATRVHGSWYSLPNAPWQNHCVAFDLKPGAEHQLRVALKVLAARYRQDSIALNLSETELIR